MTKLNDILNEIDTQRSKPLSEQLDDFRIAGAKLILSLDKYIDTLNDSIG